MPTEPNYLGCHTLYTPLGGKVYMRHGHCHYHVRISMGIVFLTSIVPLLFIEGVVQQQGFPCNANIPEHHEQRDPQILPASQPEPS